MARTTGRTGGSGKKKTKKTKKKAKIFIKPENRGSLRAALKTPKGKNIPKNKLKDKPGDSASLRKKKNFARNASKWKNA